MPKKARPGRDEVKKKSEDKKGGQEKKEKGSRVSQETYDLNVSLSQLANRKQLAETLEEFEKVRLSHFILSNNLDLSSWFVQGVSAGLANEVSYTILINAQCICGNGTCSNIS